MDRKPRIIVDADIPFIKGRLEKDFSPVYADQSEFTPELVKDAEALLIRTRTRCNESLLKDSKVRLVATATIGMDQIDIPWCQSAGITVRNSPGCNAPAVAQYVWSSLLREGFSPQTMTLGIVGCGNVGSIVAEWGEKLGARILISDPPKEREGKGDSRYVPLETLLRECDAVTLHTPLTRTGSDATYHLIGDRELGLMKDNAILVNAARGEVLDNKAALDHIGKRLTGIIDTWEGEPALNHELLDKAEIATFHIAGYSKEGKERATRMVLEALEDTFGVSLDKSGLAPAYTPVDVTEKMILDSYDPFTDTKSLREHPEDFEYLRSHYNFRHEAASQK